MAIQTVTDAIRYVGVDDNTLALFENQYPVQPMGVSYNSYVILDEKIAVMDSVDARATEEWLSNVARVLEGRRPDYLVVTHMEPDHSGSLMRLAQKYPEMKIVGNAKTFTLIKQFFGTGALSEDRMLEVGERDTLSLGLHRLRFPVSYTHLTLPTSDGGWRKRYAFLGFAPAALSAGADGTLAGGDDGV